MAPRPGFMPMQGYGGGNMSLVPRPVSPVSPVSMPKPMPMAQPMGMPGTPPPMGGDVGMARPPGMTNPGQTMQMPQMPQAGMMPQSFGGIPESVRQSVMNAMAGTVARRARQT